MSMKVQKKTLPLKMHSKEKLKVRDPKTLRNKFANVPKEYMEVAEGMEAQFVNNLIGQMRKSIQKNKPESSAEKFYNSMMDYERAKKIVKSDGVGIKDMVLKQIYPEFKRQPKMKMDPRKVYERAQKLSLGDKS